MSVVGAQRYHGVGTPSYHPSESVRRKVSQADITFALERRPRLGWQTLSKMCGVNETDLRRACGALAESPPRPPVAPAKGRGHLTKIERMLDGLVRGLSGDDLAHAADCERGVLPVMLSQAKARGWVIGSAREGGFTITVAGGAKLVAAQNRPARDD